MDNQFENDFNNAQPQRPFNEKPEPPVNAEQAPSFDFQPEKPLMQNPAPGDTQQFIPQPRQAPENINPAVQAPVPGGQNDRKVLSHDTHILLFVFFL